VTSGSPNFTSSAFSWSANPSAPTPSPYTVTSTDNLGNTSTGSSFTWVNDTTAPTGGALTVDGDSTNATAATNSTGSYTISTLTQYAESQSATQSGLASSSLVRDQTSLSGGTCGTTWTNPTTISATRTENSGNGISGGNCYRYTLTGTDNVGNSASIQIVVKVDTTAPSFGSPALTFSTTGSFAFVNGTTVYYNGNHNTASSFTVNAPNVADPESGIASVAFPTPSNITGGGTDSTAPYTTTYTGWGTSSGTGTQTVTATNGVNNTANTTFSLADDITAPTLGAFSANSVAASPAGSSSFITSGTTLTLSGRTDYSETQSSTASGLASSVLAIQLPSGDRAPS